MRRAWTREAALLRRWPSPQRTADRMQKCPSRGRTQAFGLTVDGSGHGVLVWACAAGGRDRPPPAGASAHGMINPVLCRRAPSRCDNFRRCPRLRWSTAQRWVSPDVRGAAGNTHVGEEDAALAMAQILPGDSLPPELGALAAPTRTSA